MIRESATPVHDHSSCGCGTTPSIQRPASALDLRVGGWAARTTLFSSESITIGATRCRPATESIGPESRTGSAVVAFARRGLFVLHVQGEQFLADPNQVILQNPADVFRSSHPGSIGDDTTWFAISHDVIRDAAAPFDPSAEERPDEPFILTHIASDPRTYLLQRLAFEHCTKHDQNDPLFLQEIGIALAQRVVAASYKAVGTRARHQARPDTLRAHRECAEHVKVMLASKYKERLTLEEIAASVHVAPCHLCRLFRRYTGLPIHRYLNRIRLRAAINRFLDPAANLAGVATDMGFASHSHFSDAFRKEFGLTPSAVRDGLIAGRAMRDWCSAVA
jgi:AraC family transcriptional regulator